TNDEIRYRVSKAVGVNAVPGAVPSKTAVARHGGLPASLVDAVPGRRLKKQRRHTRRAVASRKTCGIWSAGGVRCDGDRHLHPGAGRGDTHAPGSAAT